jgi:hypothetical protein
LDGRKVAFQRHPFEASGYGSLARLADEVILKHAGRTIAIPETGGGKSFELKIHFGSKSRPVNSVAERFICDYLFVEMLLIQINTQAVVRRTILNSSSGGGTLTL